MDKKITTIRLPKDLASEVSKKAKEQERSFANLLIFLLRKYLREERDER